MLCLLRVGVDFFGGREGFLHVGVGLVRPRGGKARGRGEGEGEKGASMNLVHLHLSTFQAVHLIILLHSINLIEFQLYLILHQAIS